MPIRRPRPSQPASRPPVPSQEYLKLLRCPECGRVLRARDNSKPTPLFHCGRCRHTWNWSQRDAQRIIVKVTRTPHQRTRDDRPLSWR